MTVEYTQIPSGDVDPYPKINGNNQSLGQLYTFAHIADESSGLVLRIGGGDYGGAVVDGEDLTATDDATNYVVALKSTGALSISTATTNWNDTDYGRVCIATYADGALVDDKVVDVRFEPLGIFGSQSAAGGGTELKGLRFTSDTGSTADSDPGAGLFKWNNATQGSATKLFIDEQTEDGVNVDAMFALSTTGRIFIQQSDDADRWQLWEWTAAPTDDTGYWDAPVTLIAKSTADIEDGKVCYVDFDQEGATGGAGTTGKHAIYIAAGSISPSVSGGCATLATVASAANQPDIQTLNFDQTTQEYAQFGIVMPKSWNEGTVTFKPHWSHGAGGSTFGVVWDLQAVAVGDGEAIASAFGTAQTSSDTGGTADRLYNGPESSAITVAGSPAAEEMVFFRLSRVTANGSDTLDMDARLHGITLYITTDAENDA
jgi:hypothetical protein